MTTFALNIFCNSVLFQEMELERLRKVQDRNLRDISRYVILIITYLLEDKCGSVSFLLKILF